VVLRRCLKHHFNMENVIYLLFKYFLCFLTFKCSPFAPSQGLSPDCQDVYDNNLGQYIGDVDSYSWEDTYMA
jgi:hypothetical protein